MDLLTDQTAQALRVQALTKTQQETLVLAETEKARSSFLRGISHDLRTPLTSIIGASATILENQGELPGDTLTRLVGGVQTDAQWLLSMVENILSVTRIQQNDMSITKVEEAVEEVVGEAVAAFRKRHPGATVGVQAQEDLLLVPMDALLITQVLNNLLDNARRHAGTREPEITVAIKERAGFAEISVADNGPGIPPDVLPELFEIRPAAAGRTEDASRGQGIGLTICKTIMEAHGGWIAAENTPQGARFSFGLPTGKEDEDGE